jgi:hypothetical protein
MGGWNFRVVNDTGEDLTLADSVEARHDDRLPGHIGPYSADVVHAVEADDADRDLTYLIDGDPDRPVYFRLLPPESPYGTADLEAWTPPVCSARVGRDEHGAVAQVSLFRAHRPAAHHPDVWTR